MIDKIRAMCETDPERSLTYVRGASLVIDGHTLFGPSYGPILKTINQSSLTPLICIRV